jgi:lipopolysaccharide export system permease protein
VRILDRYVAAAVVTGTAIALLVIVGMDVFFNVIAQIDDVGKGSYTVYVMLRYIALITPQGAYELFPMAALLGSLIGMGMLAANSELIAMRAAGVSIWRIVQSVLQTGVLLLLAAVFIAQRHQARHFRFGDGDFLAAPFGPAHIGNFIVFCGSHIPFL